MSADTIVALVAILLMPLVMALCLWRKRYWFALAAFVVFAQAVMDLMGL